MKERLKMIQPVKKGPSHASGSSERPSIVIEDEEHHVHAADLDALPGRALLCPQANEEARMCLAASQDAASKASVTLDASFDSRNTLSPSIGHSRAVSQVSELAAGLWRRF